MSFARVVLGGLLAACATLSLCQTGVGAEERRDTVGADLKLADGSNHFGILVLSKLLSGSDRTVVVSPYSLGTALDLLALGAQGQTADLLKKRGGQAAPTAEEQVELQRKLASPGGVVLRTANAVWLMPNATALQSYLDGARDVFKAEVKNIDFAKPESGEVINRWVKEATDGVIPNVVDKLDPQTEFMLINTTYFKGQWAERFDAAETKPAPFTRADGSTHDVAMMHASMRVRYADGGQWHAVSIPYQGNRFEMFLITAKDAKESSELRGKLGQQEFLTSLDTIGWRNREMTLSIPRFRAEFGTDLTPVLAGLGLAAAFGPDAEYKKITKEPLRATTVLQRTVVEVTEEGTEAAAATTVIGTRSIAQPVAFTADRPFFFGITDTQTGTVLFVGHVADPAI